MRFSPAYFTYIIYPPASGALRSTALLVHRLGGGGILLCPFSRRHRLLHRLKEEITLTLEHLPEPAHALEGLYLELLHILFAEQALFKSDAEQKRAGLQNYYTLWAHQIKTPIAAMSLLLQNNPGHINSELEAELFKIERCVEMVLHYLRIESPSSDFVFQYYKLDNLVRPIIRRYAKLFIHKKISLKMDNLEIEILTDAKWLSFALEQIFFQRLEIHGGGPHHNKAGASARTGPFAGHCRYGLRHSPGRSAPPHL